MERVYYDIADIFAKDLEKNLNRSIEIDEKENRDKNRRMKSLGTKKKILESEVFRFHILSKTKQLLSMMELIKN